MHLIERFTLFPNLPTELREKIWLHTVDGRCHVLPRLPITELSVCHEARNALLKVYRPKDDTSFSVGSQPGQRWVEIQGMGKSSPRSPYANYDTDVLYLHQRILRGVQNGEPLDIYLVQEAIGNISHVLITPTAWADRRTGPMRLVGAPPPPLKPNTKLVLTQFGALKTLSIAVEPSMRFDIAPLDEDRIGALRDVRERLRRFGQPDDEVLRDAKVALRASFAEEKILVIVNESTNFEHPYFKFDDAKQWIHRKAEELPDWSAPEVQCATIISDPE
ncbi:hypothetical protein LSUE1_G004427 [Lachnellula suecica]|uniref:2EXR domain-containing protein n=1 Tax=Lachnellula suecica TaxID=602035 RepID=A0A8T9C468_9HELO|nr:hypothetical protein LSUE1_G004427 [Lachnellula suecica]